MNEIDFAVWLKGCGVSNKVCSDYVSRLKRVERSLTDCDLDEEFAKDHCRQLLALFGQTGKNEEMSKRRIGDLPIGKYHLSAFPYAIRKYVAFKEAASSTQECDKCVITQTGNPGF